MQQRKHIVINSWSDLKKFAKGAFELVAFTTQQNHIFIADNFFSYNPTVAFATQQNHVVTY